ncbi:MAG TPA: ferrous iron transporter B, partial [Paenibacillus sp.]
MESPYITKGSDPLDSLLSTAKKLADGGAIRDEIVSGIYGVSAGICGDAVTYRDKKKLNSTYKLDNIVTSKIWGFP